MPKPQTQTTNRSTHKAAPFNTVLKDALLDAIREKNASNGHTITLKRKDERIANAKLRDASYESK